MEREDSNMKYIDAEKLIAELTKMQFDLNAAYRKPQSDNIVRAISLEYDDILSLVDSLQQEQPEGLHFTPLNRLIQKIPSGNWNDTVNNYAKKLRDCLIKEGYRKDAEVLQGYISYMNGNNVPMATMDGQEQPQVADASKMVQPEVDLEKEIKRFLSNATKMNKGEWRGKYAISEIGFRAVAHHFYELGLNARKED